ncbi:MAG TPA: hypothetical protein VGV15_10205 [Terriglobales bacterium]|nr:hypothetical protein [Terriglobales bacterium]
MTGTRHLFAFVLLLATSAIAQNAQVKASPLTDNDIKLARQDVEAVKDQVIKDTMGFTPAESTVFWPLYREYSKEQHAIADKRLNLITDYARNLDRMDDSTAANLTKKMFQIEGETQTLRETYYPKFETALGAKRAAKFYQIDNRLTMIVNFQLASEIPLIP